MTDQIAAASRVTTEWVETVDRYGDRTWSRRLDGWTPLVTCDGRDWPGQYEWAAWIDREVDYGPTNIGTATSLAAAKSAAERSIGEMP